MAKSLSTRFIDLIQSDSILRINPIVVARSGKPLDEQIEELRKIFESLADEANSTWFCFSTALTIFEDDIILTNVLYYFGASKYDKEYAEWQEEQKRLAA